MEETTGDLLHTPPPSTYIPFDIITETILCRLPVKSLLRFCCVRKSWNSLISKDTKFAQNHLRVSPKRQNLVTTSWEERKELTVMSWPFDSRNLHSTLTTQPTQLEYPPFVSYSWDGLIASCDGLLCFVINRCLTVLYNPSIRKLKILPYIVHPRHKGSTGYAFGYAFGYDPFIHNYKVIAVYWDDNNYMAARVEVHSYTLGSDSWERIKDFPSIFDLKRTRIHGVFVSGTVNWLTYKYSNFNAAAIVSLHLEKESYEEIPLPDDRNSINLILNVIRDCLCLFSHETGESFIDVWLMKEYSNKESWIKFIRLPYFGGLWSYSSFSKIVYISDDDNHVLLAFGKNCKSEWIVCDVKNGTMKSSKIEDNDFRIVKSEVYDESLISP